MKSLRYALAPLALALAPALSGVAMAHDVSTGPVVAPGNTLLTVMGVGHTNRTPDLAVFTAGVTSQGRTAGEALAANSADMNRVVQALRRAGIAERDIQTSNLSLNPVYAPQRTMPDGTVEPAMPRVVGYQVNNQVTVRQRNLAQFGRVIDTLVEAGANQVNGPSFQLDDSDAAANEARANAMRNARERAELYAGASGLRVVRILTISEEGVYNPAPPVVVMARGAMADMAAPTPVSAGEVSMQASVSVLFELGPNP